MLGTKAIWPASKNALKYKGYRGMGGTWMNAGKRRNTRGYGNRARRRVNWRGKNSPLPMILIALGTLLIIVLALTVPRCASSGGDQSVPAFARVDALSASPTAAALAAPTATPAPEATASTPPQATASATAANMPTATSEILGDDSYKQSEVLGLQPTADPQGYLPIFSKAETEEKIIAITVDDCFQTENLRKIVQCAIDNGGKLTILPIGENLERENLREVIRYAYENGMELENHTYTHPAFYRMDLEDMAAEIYKANRIVSETLGVNYQMHFMRTRGGDNRYDLRTHQYIAKMGYYGMAHWTMSGSTASVSTLKSTLAPGNVYLFHTTDNDLDKLLGFIPYATQQGYRLVTLNEMFGYPANEVSPLTDQEMPEPDPYVYEYKLLNKKNGYVYDVYLLQRRLIELGWLKGNADGVYGDDTYMAVGYFQKAIGMQPNGDATPDTQEALFAGDAPRSNDGKTVAGAPGEQAAAPTPSIVPAGAPVHTTAPRNVEPGPTVDLTLFD